MRENEPESSDTDMIEEVVGAAPDVAQAEALLWIVSGEEEASDRDGDKAESVAR